MAKYTVELTDAEDKAMAWIAKSVQSWIDNVVHNRARKAIDELCKEETERMHADPDVINIPADKNTIVLNSKLDTAKQKYDKEVAKRGEESA